MGKDLNKFMKRANAAIRELEAGRNATFSMDVLRDAIAELATRIEILEQDRSERIPTNMNTEEMLLYTKGYLIGIRVVLHDHYKERRAVDFASLVNDMDKLIEAINKVVHGEKHD